MVPLGYWWARHPCRETPTNSTAPYPRACRDSHSPPVAAALLSAKSIEDNVTKPSLFVSNALNSFVRASTTAVSELSVSWPKRGAGTTAGCRQLTAGATAPLTTRDEEATSAVAAAHRTSMREMKPELWVKIRQQGGNRADNWIEIGK